MKKIIFITGLYVSIFYYCVANEGMWLLPLIERYNIGTMTEMGLELTAEDIYSINDTCLKDAIAIFDMGCTAELVSPNGLLFTNHHCGYDQIQSHSTVEHDYLKNGFWAGSAEEELPNEGLEVKFLVRMEDVTETVLSGADSVPDEDLRQEMISEISDSLVKIAVDSSHYDAEVESFFDGNTYYLIVYETYKDVRLVGAPPNSIGKFGYDTDNWMWPRHTGDFSIFRVYTGPDGKPAEYSEENVPLRSKYYFPISVKGYEEGDFAMVIGYPGRTDRYSTSPEIMELLEVIHPNRIKIRDQKQQIILKNMLSDQKIYIKYALKYSRSTNYWKFSKGQTQAIHRFDIYDNAKRVEEEFDSWINEDSARIKKYGNILTSINLSVKNRESDLHNIQYMIEAFFRASEILDFATDARGLYYSMRQYKMDEEEINDEIYNLKKQSEIYFKNYDRETDKAVTRSMVELYYNDVLPDFHPDFYKKLKGDISKSSEKYVNRMYKNSVFCDENKFLRFIDKPNICVLKNDKAFYTGSSILESYKKSYNSYSQYKLELNNHRRWFMSGIMEMYPDSVFYPDANFTMRLTYGTVESYRPFDAAFYNYYTTLAGVMEKEDTTNYEFVVPEKLKVLYREKDYGEYGIKDQMPVCFITDNDITGGNSGSPVLNAKGYLIGIAFDGNWEGLAGDIKYNPEIQRCISVDIRYVLFVIDKFANAKNIIDELTIIK